MLSLVYAAAVLIVGWVVVPVVAHLLLHRKAKPVPFPPAKFVPPSRHEPRSGRKIQDPLLLALRVTLVGLLAVLGAVPMVRCSRPTLVHPQGASIALVLVVDDSLSMQAEMGGETLLQRAKDEARGWLDQTQSGDSVGVVLAGHVPRILLAPSPNTGQAKLAIEGIEPTDRATDLADAIKLACSMLGRAKQKQRQVVVLSDMQRAGRGVEELPGSCHGAVLTYPWLEKPPPPLRDCALVRAVKQADTILVTAACTDRQVATGAEVTIKTGERELGRHSLDAALVAPGKPFRIRIKVTGPVDQTTQVQLTGQKDDAIRSDDRIAVVRAAMDLATAGVVEGEQGSVATGGPPAIEQALTALDDRWRIRPMEAVPESASDLEELTVLIVDDPEAFTPEQRASIAHWLRRGGMILTALGPKTNLTTLGKSYEPLIKGAPSWEPRAPAGLDEKTVLWLGPDGPSLSKLAPKGRVKFHLEGTHEQRILASWSDGEAWLVQKRLGRGVAWTVGLPLATDTSDLVLRPGWIALLGRFMTMAVDRKGRPSVLVGDAWKLEGADEVRVIEPKGMEAAVKFQKERVVVIPPRAGRWKLNVGGMERHVLAEIDAREMDPSRLRVEKAAARLQQGAGTVPIDMSRWFVWALLVLALGEVAWSLYLGRSGRVITSNRP